MLVPHIADFGLAVVCSNMVAGLEQDFSIGLSTSFAAPEIFGTPYTITLDRFDHKGFDKENFLNHKKSDVYAFAIIMVLYRSNSSLKY